MTTFPNSHHDIGVILAERLGLSLPKREGHDLAGPCIACPSSDAFRLHLHEGVAQCYACGGKWSSFQLAEAVLDDRERAKQLMVELGIFELRLEEGEQVTCSDPIAVIARQKGVTADALRTFGAQAVSATSIQ